MIELSFSTALMTYLCLTMGTLLLLWSVTHYFTRKKKLICIEEDVATCEYCQYCYLKKIGKTITRCPQCHSFNNN